MLTWAIVYAFKIMEGHNGIWLVAAMICDVSIIYYIADAAKAFAVCH